jgi:hypothetical protein
MYKYTYYCRRCHDWFFFDLVGFFTPRCPYCNKKLKLES